MHLSWRLQAAFCFAACTSALAAQQPKQLSVAPTYTPYYLPQVRPDYAAVIGDPPSAGTADERLDLQAVLQAQARRSPAKVQEARRDDAQEDVFLYSTIFGPDFNGTKLPRLALLSAHLRNDVGVVSPPLKARYRRRRPFLANASVHPVCERKQEGSYPSGHAAVGYLTGLVLAQLVPARATEILQRADEYAHNRVVCGVHYPSDTEASHRLALVTLGEIVSSDRFREDFSAAHTEMQAAGIVAESATTALKRATDGKSPL